MFGMVTHSGGSNVTSRARKRRLRVIRIAASLTMLFAVGSELEAAPPSSSQLTRSIENNSSPERRALAFLSNEVPDWSKANHCFSCHNNGDAARALYTAHQLGYPIPKASLRDTNTWLLAPRRWKENGGNQEFSDQRLADLQFAFALHTAIKSQAVQKSQAATALDQAAALVISHQSEDGAWKISTTRALGSPATYGRYLASVAALRVLEHAGQRKHEVVISKTRRWFNRQRPLTVLDAGAALMAVGIHPGTPDELRNQCLQVIRRGEAETGGWGPYVTSAPEPFDTAIVLLALMHLSPRSELRPLVKRGRQWLVANQLDDGSWLETTRPVATISYAQRLSTCGWATLGLLKTVQFSSVTR